MNDNKNGVSNKLTLQRKTRSTLSVSSVGGKNKKVQIEIRKKLTYTQCVVQNIPESVDVNNDKVICDANNALVGLIEFNELVDRHIDNGVVNLLSSSEQISKRKSDYVDSTVCKEKVTEEIFSKISKQSSKIVGKVKSIEKKSDDYCNLELNTSKCDSNLEDSSVANKVQTPLENNSNKKKLEIERTNRFKVRTRYRGSVKLNKQRKRNTTHHRLHEILVDEFSREEELYISNRISKHKRKQSTLIQSFNKPTIKTITRDIVIGETISVSNLANKMSIKSASVIKVMMRLGIVATVNQVLDQETAQLVAEELGHNVILRRANDLEEWVMHDRGDVDNTNGIVTEDRAPIVTVMGHVDHGKTSLLDRIRSTKVASSEVGGITQSIGAYHVKTNNGMITFLDTPGHVAFTTMRARGVQLTDIVVLVVAADDGVMPQTIEAIQHIKAAKVPVVVAINKIDKSGVDIERIKNDLNYYGIVPEEWGGDTQFVNVSAVSGVGLDNLLDAILLQSELLELKVIRHGMASAVVIESFLDKKRGPVVVVLVREGTLKCGDIILCGTVYGRVRAMRDEYGRYVTLAGPSIPVELLGLSGNPAAGEMVIVVRDEKKARDVALYRQGKYREVKLSRKKESNVENIFAKIKNTNLVSELNFIVKADTRGSAEAICESLGKLSTKNIMVKILYSSIGGITETDAALAATSNAIILGFNVRADVAARHIIDLDQLDVRYYSVIYDLLNEVKQVVHGMLSPKYTHKVVGLAEVRSVFYAPKYGNVAGCMVLEGVVKRHKKIRVIRDNVVIYEGELESLRRFKNDVNEVKSGIECGICIKNYNDVNSGDIIEVFDIVQTGNA